MQFCSECHNMYYLKIQDEDNVIGNTLIYYCRNCGHEDTTLSTTNICVSDIQLRSSEKKYTHIVNEYTKFDPTLPRINTIKCPNQECSSNEMGGGGGKKTTGKEAAASKAEASKAEAATISKAAAVSKAASKKLTVKQQQQAQAQVQAQAEQAQALAKQAQEEATLAEATLKTIMEEDVLSSKKPEGELGNNREVIYIRYDDTNMKYVYLCVHCDTTWRTDNRL